MLYIILIWIVFLVIGMFAAQKFESIANMKGHEGYFWWCFWLGFVGWAMVIALPDRNGGAGIGSKGGFDNLPTI